jgi:hypothetical protein
MTILKLCFLGLLLSLGISGCGVKGDPEQPGTPVQIGRGRPSYKGLSETDASPFGPTDTRSEAEKKKDQEKSAR